MRPPVTLLIGLALLAAVVVSVDLPAQGINRGMLTPSPSITGASPYVVGKTGTGNFVLQTSPTLITPVLGVASATSIGHADGTVCTAPSINFTSDPTTGLVLNSAGDLRFCTSGSTRLIITGGVVQGLVPVSATAYQISGNAFSKTTVGPSTPVGTVSTTLVMAGLAGSITTRAGSIELCAAGNLTDNTANDGTKAQMSYGINTAPVNGAALTGTQVGSIWQYNASTLAAGALAPYGGCWIVTGLSAGTAYWYDMAFAAITGGTGSLNSATMVASDIP